MAELTGIAKRYDGTAVDYVSIFDWDNGKCIAQIIPNAMGAWSYEYIQRIKIGITYVADGCEPITHGAYEFTGFNATNKLLYYSFNTATAGANDSAFTLHGGASIDATVSKFGAGSLKVNAANQYALSAPIPAIGLDDYCFEFFIKTSKRTGDMTFFDTRYGGYAAGLSVQSNDGKGLHIYSNSTYLVEANSIPYDATNWLHMAVTRHNGILRFFLGGVKKAEVVDTNSYAANTVMIGNNVNAIDRHFVGGHIDEFAVSKGDARYTKDFTPPTRAFY